MRHWDDFFYGGARNPATGRGTLRNRFGITLHEQLDHLEFLLVTRRVIQLDLESPPIPARVDGAVLTGLHHWMYQDVYDWAGELRAVDLAPDGRVGLGVSASGGAIEQGLEAVWREAADIDWPALDHAEFAEACASVFAGLWHVRPFLAGNGIVSRVLLQRIAAAHTEFHIDYAKVNPLTWRQAVTLTEPGDHRYLQHILAHMIQTKHEFARERASALA